MGLSPTFYTLFTVACAEQEIPTDDPLLVDDATKDHVKANFIGLKQKW